MNTSRAMPLLLSGLLCVSAALADESWRGKPSSEWDQKEIRQILEHSPWAHRQSVFLVRPAGQVTGCVGSSGPCQRADSFRAPNTTHSSSTLPSPATTSSDLSGQVKAQETQDRYSAPVDSGESGEGEGVAGVAVIRWVSSRTVRDALAQLVPPSGKRMDAEELAQLAPADAYILYVDLRVDLADVSRVPKGGILTPGIARHSFLLVKTSGERIPAVRVAAAPLPEFDDRKELALAAFYIYFPRQKSGHAVLPQRESEVRFECPLAPVPIRADFKLSRMERAGSPDF